MAKPNTPEGSGAQAKAADPTAGFQTDVTPAAPTQEVVDPMKATADAPAPAPAPAPVADPGTVTLGSVATGSAETVEVAAGIPSSPCFDYNPETGKPNLRGDETMLSEKIRNGVRVVVTTSGRKIFCCSLPKFCEAFGPPPMPVDYYLKFFPWAK